MKDTSKQTQAAPLYATTTNGHIWTGERNGEWWMYRDENGKEYESREVPAYRIKMDNATQVTCEDGTLAIAPLPIKPKTITRHEIGELDWSEDAAKAQGYTVVE